MKADIHIGNTGTRLLLHGGTTTEILATWKPQLFMNIKKKKNKLVVRGGNRKFWTRIKQFVSASRIIYIKWKSFGKTNFFTAKFICSNKKKISNYRDRHSVCKIDIFITLSSHLNEKEKKIKNVSHSN